MEKNSNKQLYKAIVITAISAGIANCFLPWWIVGVVAFVVVVSHNLNGGKGFLSGAVGVALAWLVLLLWKDIPNQHILSGRMATLILGSPNYWLLILVTILLGALAGGLSGWSGGLMTKAFRKSK